MWEKGYFYYLIFYSYDKPIAAISTINFYLFMCQLDIKQCRHRTSGGQWASTCRWVDAHVVEYQEQARGSANRAWQHQPRACWDTETHALVLWYRPAPESHILLRCKAAKGIAVIMVNLTWTMTLSSKQLLIVEMNKILGNRLFSVASRCKASSEGGFFLNKHLLFLCHLSGDVYSFNMSKLGIATELSLNTIHYKM